MDFKCIALTARPQFQSYLRFSFLLLLFTMCQHFLNIIKHERCTAPGKLCGSGKYSSLTSTFIGSSASLFRICSISIRGRCRSLGCNWCGLWIFRTFRWSFLCSLGAIAVIAPFGGLFCLENRSLRLCFQWELSRLGFSWCRGLTLSWVPYFNCPLSWWYFLD